MSGVPHEFGTPGWRRHVPNALTILRFVMAGACVWLLTIASPEAGDAALLATALGLFVLASITDALDGYLARRWRVVSPFGRVMDPLADKVLVLGTLIALGGANFVMPESDGAGGVLASGVWPWMAVVVVTRELLVTSIRGVYESAGVDFSASWSGKIKMVAQSAGSALILLGLTLIAADTGEASLWRTVNAVTAWAIVGLTAWSALPYVARAVAKAPELRKASA